MSANFLLRVDLLMFRQKQQTQQRCVRYVELNFDVLDANALRPSIPMLMAVVAHLWQRQATLLG